MQNAKDTFYETLRDRIATLNPNRTVVLRGVVRPGIFVAENELVSAIDLPDCFRLSWTKATTDMHGCLPAVALTCEIAYETAGTALNAGMDRGRMLSAMDAELLTAIAQSPQSVLKQNYAPLAFGGTVAAMQSNIWWSNANFGEAKVNDDRIGRTATVMVMSYEEAGEL